MIYVRYPTLVGSVTLFVLWAIVATFGTAMLTAWIYDTYVELRWKRLTAFLVAGWLLALAIGGAFIAWRYHLQWTDYRRAISTRGG